MREREQEFFSFINFPYTPIQRDRSEKHASLIKREKREAKNSLKLSGRNIMGMVHGQIAYDMARTLENGKIMVDRSCWPLPELRLEFVTPLNAIRVVLIQ